MQPQATLGDLEYMTGGRTTHRQAFLNDLEELIPWDEWISLIRSAYDDTEGRRGRPSIGAEVMLRAYLVQVAFHLSDVATEEAIIDSRAISAFVGRGLEAPDSTTICKFRHALEEAGIGKKMFEELVSLLDKRGLIMHKGTIVDATFIEAPSSTKNKDHTRDSEARQAKKGNNWHFGYKEHIGVDPESGLAHSVIVTSANVADIAEANHLIRDDDTDAWGDAGYVGIDKRDDAKDVTYHIAQRQSQVTNETRAVERQKSSVRSVVEHTFHTIKDIFGLRKTRYKGLQKNENQLFVATALSDLLMTKRGRRPYGPPEVLSCASMEKACERAAKKEEERAKKKAAKAEAAKKKEERMLAKAHKQAAKRQKAMAIA